MTESEALFERFCRGRNISINHLEEGPRKMTDYEIRYGRLVAAAEVKEIGIGEQDRRFVEPLKRPAVVAGFVDSGRPRNAIREATRQLRAYAKGRMGGMVVLYDTTCDRLEYLGSAEIAHCLFGSELHQFAAQFGQSGSNECKPKIIRSLLGGGRIATTNDNTTLRAVAVLNFDRPRDLLSLVVYHNHHAALPISPDDLRVCDVRHFAYEVTQLGGIGKWVER